MLLLGWCVPKKNFDMHTILMGMGMLFAREQMTMAEKKIIGKNIEIK